MSTLCYCQTVKEVFTNGKNVDKREKIFLKLEDNKIKYDINDRPSEFIDYEDSTIFLVRKNMNIYMRPINPLNYSFSSEIEIIDDPIMIAASKALASISDVLENLAVLKGVRLVIEAEKAASDCDITDLQKALKNIINLNQKNLKEQLASNFKELKELDFEDEEQTDIIINKASSFLSDANKHLAKLESLTNDLETSVKSTTCPIKIDNFLLKTLMDIVIQDARTIKKQHEKRLKVFKEAFEKVDSMKKDAKRDGVDVPWVVKVNTATVSVTPNKISNFTITISESGYSLSDENEIIKSEGKEVVKKTLRFRKFQRFVPEVSAGIAYTFLEFPQFGTESDPTGQMLVSDAGTEEFKRINFNAMVNFNLYLENSLLVPFFQVGVGANTDYPVLFSGIGINVGQKFNLSFGFASTWIKQLNDLKIGDKISGTADIEEDITYDFNWPPKGYIGIQYDL
ncbi:MAG: hypothetical protein AAF944_26070 [Bacteroidota bacterium]